jgi:ribosome biogenesis GTPase / thiamine phosphate phosphatase
MILIRRLRCASPGYTLCRALHECGGPSAGSFVFCPSLTASDVRFSGRVVAAFGRRFVVETPEGEKVPCVPRGKHGTYVCGDRVFARRTGSAEGVIEAADPRSTLFLRAARHRQKLIAANATQVAVIAAGEPSASDELVCRILIAAECLGIQGLIVLNKIDLIEATQAARARLEPFRAAGHRLVEICAKHDVAPLRALLATHTTILIGQSGMGKSTIVNALVPDALAATQDISRFLDSGRHTTSHSRLYRLDASSAIIDCPGIEEFGLAHLSAAAIERAFRDLAGFVGQCRFRDCTHRAEPGCAVQAAAETGLVARRRLDLLHLILAAEAAPRR